eukprot:CAMPEP_0197022888 /NCGR_PEP_ID=MMETSP1384-20130603/3695_1 /TAXON_ID=29189 /ORGANISM="Ammonia sp." /LENGTH=389 /DNA_ID=CAMNT_0042451009 /DNA_START=68 /DNA_END=1237 /DNA_ORIENTATION=+
MSVTWSQEPTFVDPESAKPFECAICHGIIKEAVQVHEEHVFCRECLNEWTAERGFTFNCPLCRKRCSTVTVSRVRFIDQQIHSLKVKCPNHAITAEKANYIKQQYEAQQQQHPLTHPNESDALQPVRRSKRLLVKEQARKKRKLNIEETCEWTGNLSQFQAHCEECPLQLIACTFCDDSVLRRDLSSHYETCSRFPVDCHRCHRLHIPRSDLQTHLTFYCPRRRMQCVQRCGVVLFRGDLLEHIKEECSKTVLACSYQRHGCTASFARSQEDNHYKTQMETHLELVSKCVQRLEESHTSLQARYDNLEAEHGELEDNYLALQRITNRVKLRVDRLEAHMQNTRDNMDQLERRMSDLDESVECLREKESFYDDEDSDDSNCNSQESDSDF